MTTVYENKYMYYEKSRRAKKSILPRIIADHLGSIRVVLNEQGNVDSWSDYYPFGKEARGSSTNNEPKEQFTSKERDIEIGLDYFGARYYNYDICRWLSLDPIKDKYPNINPYHYVFNNPVCLIDATGLDSTFYIQNVSSNVDKDDLNEIVTQVQYVLDENGIPMRVKATTDPPIMDPTDVSIKILDGDHPTVKNYEKEKKKNVGGYSEVGSQEGWIDESEKKKNGVTNVGLGNTTLHEGMHGMGVSHEKHGEKGTIIYTVGEGGVKSSSINKKDQIIGAKQKEFILKVFLNKPKKVEKPREEEKKDEK